MTRTNTWADWKPPDNWREIIEEGVEILDRHVSRMLEECTEDELSVEEREWLTQWVDKEIDNLRRGTFFQSQIEEKLR